MKRILGLIMVFLLVLTLSFVSPAQIGNIQTNLQSSLETLSSGTSTTITGRAYNLNSDEENHESEKESCQENKGCYTNGKHKECYPYGYILNNSYCAGEGRNSLGKTAEESAGFKEQKSTGEKCLQNFECLTNFCSEGICINETEEINRQVDIKIDEMKQDIVYKIDKGLDKLNETESLSISTGPLGGVSVDKSVVERVLIWIKEIFS